MPNPQIAAAALARMVEREQIAERIAQLVPTGEPCRCPEHVLECHCGAYTR